MFGNRLRQADRIAAKRWSRTFAGHSYFNVGSLPNPNVYRKFNGACDCSVCHHPEPKSKGWHKERQKFLSREAWP
jgi:hypothetical protein